VSHSEDVTIAKAVLAGCQPVYDDYGHPERATSRKYWTATCVDGRTVYGYTRADCCKEWLWIKEWADQSGWRPHNER
jgi:hypothetical protein